jgi:hypothetical protein
MSWACGPRGGDGGCGGRVKSFSKATRKGWIGALPFVSRQVSVFLTTPRWTRKASRTLGLERDGSIEVRRSGVRGEMETSIRFRAVLDALTTLRCVECQSRDR